MEMLSHLKKLKVEFSKDSVLDTAERESEDQSNLNKFLILIRSSLTHLTTNRQVQNPIYQWQMFVSYFFHLVLQFKSLPRGTRLILWPAMTCLTSVDLGLFSGKKQTETHKVFHVNRARVSLYAQLLKGQSSCLPPSPLISTAKRCS